MGCTAMVNRTGSRTVAAGLQMEVDPDMSAVDNWTVVVEQTARTGNLHNQRGMRTDSGY